MKHIILNILSRITGHGNKKRKTVIAVLTVGLILILSTVLYSLVNQGDLRLSPVISNISQLVPSDSISWYSEIHSPSAFYTAFKTSKPGRQIVGAPVWTSFFAGPSFRQINHVKYMIDSSLGRILSLDDVIKSLNGPVGFAKYQDGSFICAAELNLKSEIALKIISLISDSKVVTVNETKTLPEETNESGHAVPNTFTDTFSTSSITIGNIKVNQFRDTRNALYYLVSGKYAIMSDSTETLKKSIICGSGNGNGSIHLLKDFNKALTDYGNKDILFFQHVGDSLYGQAVKALFGTSDIAAVVKPFESRPSAGLFFLGAEEKNQKPSPEWGRIVPKDSSIAIMSSKEIMDIVKAMRKKAAGNNGESVIDRFFQGASISPETYFGGSAGFSLLLNRVTLSEKELFPEFALAYTSDVKDNSLVKAFFKTDALSKESFQNRPYETFSIMNGGHYTPSFFQAGDYCLIASAKPIIHDFIAASSANKPKISDSPGFAEFTAQKPVTRIVFNMPMILEDIRTFYSFAAETSSGYTAETIKKDVLPLFDVLKDVKTVQVAVGGNGQGLAKVVE